MIMVLRRAIQKVLCLSPLEVTPPRVAVIRPDIATVCMATEEDAEEEEGPWQVGAPATSVRC